MEVNEDRNKYYLMKVNEDLSNYYLIDDIWVPICERCKRVMKYLCGDEKKFYYCPVCDTSVYVVAKRVSDEVNEC